MVREARGIEPLVAIAKEKSLRDNKPLLAAATGAIWKCAVSDENVTVLEQVPIKSNKNKEAYYIYFFNSAQSCASVG